MTAIRALSFWLHNPISAMTGSAPQVQTHSQLYSEGLATHIVLHICPNCSPCLQAGWWMMKNIHLLMQQLCPSGCSSSPTSYRHHVIQKSTSFRSNSWVSSQTSNLQVQHPHTILKPMQLQFLWRTRALQSFPNHNTRWPGRPDVKKWTIVPCSWASAGQMTVLQTFQHWVPVIYCVTLWSTQAAQT